MQSDNHEQQPKSVNLQYNTNTNTMENLHSKTDKQTVSLIQHIN